ncbi:MAG: MOSC domain-containing protein [Planctomycetota bacterium]|nr:MAG: MOSC domain-containing protein [Planctomycetota bacterium]
MRRTKPAARRVRDSCTTCSSSRSASPSCARAASTRCPTRIRSGTRKRAEDAGMSATAGELGRIAAVCTGPGGIPKRPIERAELGALGLAGDAHRYKGHGGPNRAVCILFEQDYAELERDGVKTSGPGTFGENLLIAGVDRDRLRPGDRLHIGEREAGVVIEIHDVREPCKTLRPLDARFPNLMLGRSGFVCRVIRAGVLERGQPVLVVPARARDS